MKSKSISLLLAGTMLLSVAACSGWEDRTLDYLGKRPTTGSFFKEDETPMVELNYKAGNIIANQLEERLPPGSPITVTMFRMRGSDVQTDFAKVLTEQVASRIAQEGFAVVADSSQFPTRPMDDGLPAPIKCVLAGAYSVGSEQITITAAVSTLRDGEIMGSYDWTVPLNAKTRSLLPIEESPYIDPLVNTSGPVERKEDASFESNFVPEQQHQTPSFEQNIME
ncbi:hypothetical protein [Maridesulfovibrio sp. FT414]|uniref:hypothetical protein n=1 Tax=Maridesulfovibrio sp. FT414 TaxID=2979469 RepID=UPI003D803C1C